MGNHFVPQLYLQGFTQDGKLWAHDKNTKKSFQTQPKSVANETGMYPDELESYFTEKIEQPAHDAIERIRSNSSLSSSDKLALANYLAALWKRGPAGRSRSAERLPAVASTVEKNLHKQIDDLVSIEPHLNDLAEEKKELISNIIKKNAESNSKNIWHNSLSSESTPKIINALLSMNWQFLTSKELIYLTSDNPLFFFAHEGIGPITAEVTIPFSSSIALWMNRSPKPKPLYSTATTAFVREVNRRTAYNATRFTFSSINEAWISNLSFKNHHSLNRISW
ncbi:DUF4238 domain-containing protein [Rhodanobacter sp. Si-c]|uniref:DUF4238 domain-containing protein n=1 Tax=Rhodanobacter lycopersici TaxID=3162487 RepID=A0ABV3QH46_9GAMM